ncbi:MAG: hypothetical protein OXI63_21740 [Candidatus Poribacteria bacterium]|nr:hypothetical protein [Candidatus Poribacteria bacterium]
MLNSKGIQLSVFGVGLFAGDNTLYMLCFLKIRRNFRWISLDFAVDPAKKAVQSNNFLKLNGSALIPEPFSFKYSLYLCEYNSPVRASCARDIAKKR